jgi:hypothetical protein
MSMGSLPGVLQSFEDRTNREPREEGGKSSGHADEITGSNATISNSKISNSKICNSEDLQLEDLQFKDL